MKQTDLKPQIAPRPGHVINLGMVEYEEALEHQIALRDKRIAGAIPDTLVLLEHPAVITVGRSGNMENVLVPARRLAEQGIQLLHTNRGGDVTYHEPGQVVGYTIVDLRPYGLDVRAHLRRLEEVIIQALIAFGIRGSRIPGCTGVWVEDEKVASIGLHIKQWVTMHGFALNLQPELDNFSLIYPCGIRDKTVTSVARVLGHPVESSQARKELAQAFGRVLGLSMEEQAVFSKVNHTASPHS